MNANKSNPFVSDDNWFAGQQKYWQSWFDYCQSLAAVAPNLTGGKADWATGFDKWWETVTKSGLSPDADAFMRQLLSQGKAFATWSEWISEVTSNTKQPLTPQLLADTLQKQFNELRGLWAGESANTVGQHGIPDFTVLFRAPMDVWNTVNATVPNAKLSGFMDAFKIGDGAGLDAPLREPLQRLLGLPGIGYTREWQEGLQKAAILTMDYERACSDYHKRLYKVVLEAGEQFVAKLKLANETDDPPKSLRALYDLWVDCNENAYSEFALSADYADLYGAMINSQMRLKQHMQKLTDDFANAVSLPTREGLTSLQRHQHELRREVGRLRASVSRLEQAQVSASTTSTLSRTADKPEIAVHGKSTAKSGRRRMQEHKS